MIVENNLDRNGYAVVLLAGIHIGEYQWPVVRSSPAMGHFRTTWLWDGYAVNDLCATLDGKAVVVGDPRLTDETWGVAQDRTNAAFKSLWPNIEEAYYEDNPYKPHDYNAQMFDDPASGHLVLYQGSRVALAKLYEGACRSLAEEMGGDDSTFDYWPSEFGTACAFAYDLQQLHPEGGYIGDMRGIWDSQVTRMMQREEWPIAPPESGPTDERARLAAWREWFSLEITARPE